MARNKLTATQLKGKTTPGRLGDGDGLYFHVSPGGSRSWVFVYIRRGKRREMGLGAYGTGTGQVSLADARVKADEIRTILGRGGDPFVEMTERRATPIRKTFAEMADELLATKAGTWRNDKHRAQWEMTLGDAYCAKLRPMPVDAITTEDIVSVLEPHWLVKHETASRLRGRIERVLDFAKVGGLRDGENPARWKGHLEHRFAKPDGMVRGHHAAMPWSALPAFIAVLRSKSGIGARALEFTIATAARTGETIDAQWPEFDLAAKLWTVPGERMKAGREHRVPLSQSAMRVLQALKETARGPFVFPGARDKRPISGATMTKSLNLAGGGAYTVHGFRSSFRDWTHEATTFQREVAEAALAHIDGDETERAYRRGDALAKRRKLMDAWDKYISSKTK